MTEQSSSKANVLLLDDDKFLVDMYSMKFQQSGFNVHACLSTADALKTLRDGFSADVIVFDLVMPEGDGFAFLESIKNEKLAEHAVKIALTNQMNDADMQRVMALGGTRYIVKATMIPSEVVNSVVEEIAKKRN